jgi:hypothetical protein
VTPEQIGQLVISDGISKGKTWGTYRQLPNGSLKRVVSPQLPLRATKSQAEADLATWLTRLIYLKGTSQQRKAAVEAQRRLGL